MFPNNLYLIELSRVQLENPNNKAGLKTSYVPKDNPESKEWSWQKFHLYPILSFSQNRKCSTRGYRKNQL